MNKREKLVLLFCLLPIFCFGQSFRISYESGYGLYNMADLKQQQQAFIRNSTMPIKSVEEFPGYFNHLVSVDYYLDKDILFGINAAYLTTGGRNSLSDYSGEYNLDMILAAYQYGIESEYNLALNNKLYLFSNFKLGIINSKLKIHESLIVYNTDSNVSNQILTQSNFFMEPNFGLSYKIAKKLFARTTVGLNIDTSLISKKLLDWSGLRTRIGVSYLF